MPRSLRRFRRLEAIQKRGHELHKARRAEKKELRLIILGDRLDLAETVVRDEIKAIDTQASSTLNWFGESDTDADKTRQFASARKNLEEALRKISSDRKELENLAKSPLASDFYPRLRKLEGADFDIRPSSGKTPNMACVQASSTSTSKN